MSSQAKYNGNLSGTSRGNSRQLLKLLSCKGVTFHTLRHTAASHMVMNGVPLATVKEILRHKDYAMTLRYAHLSPDHKKSAVDTIGNALREKSDNAETTEKTA